MISEVHNIDCMKFMATLPDKFFDLAIVDPPYGIGESLKTKSRPITVKQKNGSRLYVSTARKHAIKEWDLNRADESYFELLYAKSENQIIWGGNYYCGFLPPKSGWIVWDKLNQSSHQSDCELAFTSFNCGIRKFEYLWNGFLQGSSGNHRKANGDKKLNEKRIHPTQKPVALYKWLLKNYAKPGDKIFDSHMGSQSSRIAAYDMGFDYWGCELDKDYFDAGCKRFELFKSQMKIFQ